MSTKKRAGFSNCGVDIYLFYIGKIKPTFFLCFSCCSLSTKLVHYEKQNMADHGFSIVIGE